MDMIFFIKGIVMGLMGSIPLGPIGVLCIQRTLSGRFRSGFASGLGAATADTIFATVALFFYSLVMSFIESRMTLLTVIGGIIIIAIGVSLFVRKTKVHIRRNRVGGKKIFKDYISTFLLTLTNPAYILVFIALFSSVGIARDGSMSVAGGVLTLLGVAAGACSWWFVLTFAVDKLRRRFRPRHLVILNKAAGVLIFVLGVIAVISAFVSGGIKSI
ncbi:MAG: LysE family translocator [Rikenellaceae bacterium]|nr:LysE family translocator [Rikenellaceae bacterium]